MHTKDQGQTTVHELIEHMPEASHVLRSYNVDVTASQELTLAEVARSVSTSLDDIMAVVEYRMRQAAKNH
jgi:iron-sulfur cluster repair protein YtfE (RIC family)